MPKRKKRTVSKKRKDEEVDDETEGDSAKKVAAASSTSQSGDDGEEISSFTSIPLLMASDEGVKGSKTSHFMCNYCEFSAESKVDLVSHMRKHMIKCTKCQFSSLSRKEVTQHCKEEHDVDFEATTNELATSSTEIEMDKDPCSACVFCKFMTYSTEHLERHTSLKHPGMLPKSVAKMVTKQASTQIRQGDVRFYLSLAGNNNIDNKLVSSSPPKMVSSEPIEIEDERPIDIKPKFEPPEQKVSTEILKKMKREANDTKSLPNTHASDTFTQQLAKHMKMESVSVRSEADTSETERKPEGVKVETIYCLTCPFSNVLIDKLKCHTLVQHPLGAAVATYSASESSLSDFTFFCVKEECPYNTGDLNEYQSHLMHCCSSIKSLKIIEKERFKSTVSFIFDLQKKHSLEEEKGFIEYAMFLLPHPLKAVRKPEITLNCGPSMESQSSVQQTQSPSTKVSDSKVNQQMQAMSDIIHPVTHNQDSEELQIVENAQEPPPGLITSHHDQNGQMINSNLSASVHESSSSRQKHQHFAVTGPTNNIYNYDNLPNESLRGDLIQQNQSQLEETSRLPNFLNAETVSSARGDQSRFQAQSQTISHNVGSLPFPTPRQQILHLSANNSPFSSHQQVAYRREGNEQASYKNTSQIPTLPQTQTPVRGLSVPQVAQGRPVFRGRGRPPKVPAPVENSVPDDDVIVTAVVRMSPSNQRGRPPTLARGRSPALRPQRMRAPAPVYGGQAPNQPRGRGVMSVPNYGQAYSRQRGRGVRAGPNFTPLSQHRPFDMSSHFEALACAANPDEEDDLQIVGMTPGKDGSFGNPKAVDANRFSFCCLHCGKDQGSKSVMKQHMKACHNDTLLGAFTNIDTGQWLYFCPQINCAFMTYDEQRLSDHLQKCCDPEKWKAFDFGVAMNNLKSMKIRQMEVRNMSGSQGDPLDLDGRGMRDRFSTSLNDAFDDILVNTTGRQMVRPVSGRRPRASLNQRVQARRMPHPYQPACAMVGGRGSMPRSRQPMEGMVRSFNPRARFPMPRQPGMNYNTPGFNRPLNRRPGIIPQQHLARGMIPTQRPRMPHPITNERPQPTTFQNPILIDVDPDSPEQPRSDSCDAVGNVNFASRPNPQSGNSEANQGEPSFGQNNALQYPLETQTVESGNQLISDNQNSDQSASNIFSAAPSQSSGSSLLTLPLTLNPNESDIHTGNSLSFKDSLKESYAPRPEQQAGTLLSETCNEPQSNLSCQGNPLKNLLNSSNPLSSIIDQTTVTDVSISPLDVKDTIENQAIGAQNTALNSEYQAPCLFDSTDYHKEDKSPEVHTQPSTEKGSPQRTHVSKAPGLKIPNAEIQNTPVSYKNSVAETSSSISGDMLCSHPFLNTEVQYSTASFNNHSALSGDAEPVQPSEEKNLAQQRPSLSEAQSLAPLQSMQSESHTSEQQDIAVHKDKKSIAKTHSLPSKESLLLTSSLLSPFEGQAFGSQTSDMQKNSSCEAPTNTQSELSTKVHNLSNFDDESSVACPTGSHSPSSNDSHTAAPKAVQSVPPTKMISVTSPSKIQSEFSADTQATPLSDVQSVIPNKEKQPALVYGHQSLSSLTEVETTEHSREEQFVPSASKQFSNVSRGSQPLETDFHSEVLSCEVQSESLTVVSDVQSVALSNDAQSVPLKELSSPTTDRPAEFLSDKQQLSPTKHQLDCLSREKSGYSATNDKPTNNSQSTSLTSSHPPATNDEHFVPQSNEQAVLSVSPLLNPSNTSTSIKPTASTVTQSGFANDLGLQSVSLAYTKAVYTNGAQAAPTVGDSIDSMQSISSTISKTILSTQSMPTRNEQSGFVYKTPVTPSPISIQTNSQAHFQPGVPRTVENEPMSDQGNESSSSKLLDEEERINAVVLEKVFAKVPDMPKTLSRRLVFKFKQYANYKNVKITSDSKVIDEFVSKISYKRSGSADQKSSKAAQVAGSSGSATMSTRSGKSFTEPPSGREKTVSGLAASSQEILLPKSCGFQNLNTLKSTPPNRQISPQALDHRLQEDKNSSAKELPSNQSDVPTKLSNNQNSSAQSYPLSETNVSESSLAQKSVEMPSQILQGDTSYVSQSLRADVSEMQRTLLQSQTVLPSGALLEENSFKKIPSHQQKDSLEGEEGSKLKNITENRFLPSNTDKTFVCEEVSGKDCESQINTSVDPLQRAAAKTTVNHKEEISYTQNDSQKLNITPCDLEHVEKQNSTPEKDNSEAGGSKTMVYQEDNSNVEESTTAPDQIVSDVNDLEHEEVQSHENCGVSCFDSIQKDGPLPAEGQHKDGTDKNISVGQQQARIKSATPERDYVEGTMHSVGDSENITDIIETHVILPERSIQFSGVFGKLVEGLKQTPKADNIQGSSFSVFIHEKTQGNITETTNVSKDNRPISQLPRTTPETTKGLRETNEPEIAKESSSPDHFNDKNQGEITSETADYSKNERSISEQPKNNPNTKGLKQSRNSEMVKGRCSSVSDNKKPHGDITTGESKGKSSLSQHPRNKPETTKSVTQSSFESQDCVSSFKLDKLKLKQVLKRTKQFSENNVPKYKKLKFSGRRASAPDPDTLIEAAFLRESSPESNSCPAQPSSNNSDKEGLTAKSQCDTDSSIAHIAFQDMQPEWQTLSIDKEECPTIASLIAANLAAEREQKDLSPKCQESAETFLNESSSLKSTSHENSSLDPKAFLPTEGASSSTALHSLPAGAKEKAEKPDLVDKKTGRLILKVKKHNIPRFKAPQPSTSGDSMTIFHGPEKKLDHFVRRSLRERKLIHREQNEATEMDELISEDDDEYHVEEDSDAYSSDSTGSWEKDSDHPHPKRIRKAKPAPDPSAFDYKTKGKYKCWLCRKIFLKCGSVKSHILKKHLDKGLCAIDVGQSDFLCSPQLLLFCPRKCRYATVSMEGLKNHMVNCEREILNPLEVVKSFVGTDYDELLKMGEKVLEIGRPARKRKKSQAKKTMFAEDITEAKTFSGEFHRDADSENSLVLTEHTPTIPISSVLTEHTSTKIVSSSLTQHTSTDPVSSVLTQHTPTENVSSILTQHTPTEAVSLVLTQHTPTEAVSSVLTQHTPTEAVSSVSTQHTSTEAVSSILLQHTPTEAVSSVFTQHTPTEPLSSVLKQHTPNESVKGTSKPFEPSPTPVPPTSELYEVVDVDLDFPEPVQQLPYLHSNPQHQRFPIQQNNHYGQQHFSTNLGDQASSSDRPGQNFNTGQVAPQPRQIASKIPHQVTAGAAGLVNRSNASRHIQSSTTLVRHRMPQSSPVPRQVNVYQTLGFQSNANTQQHKGLVRGRANLNQLNASLTMQKPHQQRPRFTQAVLVRGTHPANPRPHQTPVCLPRQQMPQQSQQPRQESFALQRCHTPRQSVGSQLRPRMMMAPSVRGRGSVGINQQQWSGSVGGVGQGNVLSHPKQRVSAYGVVRNKNPGPVNQPDDSYTVTESGVICLD